MPPERAYVKRNMKKKHQAPPTPTDPLAKQVINVELRATFQVLS